MKHFVKRILLFLVFGTTCFIPMHFIDILISSLLRPKGYQSSWIDLYSNNINSDLVIFGSSRAQQHIVSNLIADSLKISVYNLGGAALPIELQLIRLKLLLNNCSQKPKYISLECCYHSIANGEYLFDEYQIYPYMYRNHLYETYTHLLSQSFSKYDFYIPIYRYRHRLLKMIKETIKKDTCCRGYYNLGQERNASEYFVEDTDLRFDISSERVDYLKEFIEICQQNNIKIDIIYTPEYYWQKYYTNKTEILDTIKKVAELYRIPFKDFSCDSIPINTDTIYYHDYTHLIDKGARKFTSEYYVPYIKSLYGF